MIDIVLVEPEIPMNTGNIARTCAATGARLHLIEPLGFDISDRAVKRAGLDYWPLVKVHYHDSFEEVQERYAGHNFYFLSTKAPRSYTEVSYTMDDMLVFGKESAGIPEPILKANWDHCVRIPMIAEARSLNLSNSVAVVAYEAMRQMDFQNLAEAGPGLRMDHR